MRCPDCGAVRTVSLEHACRIARGENGAKCDRCRRPVPIRVTEEHRQFWLRVAGVTEPLAARGGAARYVRKHGIPQALNPIIASTAFLPLDNPQGR